ncbi:MAG: AAA family ATPase, partial [Dehalococcoidia bacterium]
LGHGARPTIDFVISVLQPHGPALVGQDTRLKIRPGGSDGRRVRYKDVGGVGPQLRQVREVVELPLTHPELFQRLGIDPPKGVLLYGPPGTGKTLIARAVAGETSAHFIHVSGPEVFHKFVGESEGHLRDVFQEARENAPTIIFLDEIDSIAARRDDVFGEVEKRVVAQLMALMDGLEARGQVMVIAATNIPDALDPALRRPGRFDREIHVGVPDRVGRAEILAIHTKNMPLAADVDLDELAGVTHGYAGADLANLCREAAMVRLRHTMACMDGADPAGGFAHVTVTRDDFYAALAALTPAAIRGMTDGGAKTGWHDVGGLDDAKRLLQETIAWPLTYGALFARAGVRPARGVLLYGPPGVGKTLLARAAAGESGAHFIAVSGAQLLSKWVGESEKAVRELFRKARMTAPAILFFDDLDAVAGMRGAGQDSGVTERVVSQLLSEIDALATADGVVVIGATNRPDLVDPALLGPGRLDLRIPLPLPDTATRRAVAAVHTRGQPLAPDVSLDRLAEATQGLSGGDIALICRRAAMLAIRDYVDAGGNLDEVSDFVIGDHHFRAALREHGRGADQRRLTRGATARTAAMVAIAPREARRGIRPFGPAQCARAAEA